MPSLFGDKLTGANAKITALVALIASTGFKIDAAVVADPKTEASALPTADQFKAFLAERNKAATDAAVTAAVDPLNARVTALGAEATAFRSGFEAAGLKIADFISADKAEGATPDEKAKAAAAANASAVKLVVESAVAARAARQIASSGHPAALDVPAGDGEGKRGESKPAAPSSKEEFHAGLRAIADPAERQAYFRQHKAKFGL